MKSFSIYSPLKFLKVNTSIIDFTGVYLLDFILSNPQAFFFRNETKRNIRIGLNWFNRLVQQGFSLTDVDEITPFVVTCREESKIVAKLGASGVGSAYACVLSRQPWRPRFYLRHITATR